MYFFRAAWVLICPFSVSSSAFTSKDFPFRNALSKSIDRLCLEFEAESAKQHRRLRNLFQMPFTRLETYRKCAESVIDTFGDQVGSRAIPGFVDTRDYHGYFNRYDREGIVDTTGEKVLSGIF